MRYLYGASVQGIQDFIFQTNKLKEIGGASELVEQICTSEFWRIANIEASDPNIIINAAGNIKYIFENKTHCENFVRNFPKNIMTIAPGITISQAVVEYTELSNDVMQELENRLRIQRNKSIKNLQGGLMVIETARRTGQSGVKWEDNDKKEVVIDLAQSKKHSASKQANQSLYTKIIGVNENLKTKFPYEMEDIARKDSNSWIAVVHADGNNLGQKLINIFPKFEANEIQTALREFSSILNNSTIQATKDAFNQSVGLEHEDKIPFRPVVLGGDDLTAIIRGDLALSFTKIFLSKFEECTKSNFQNAENGKLKEEFKNGLTACAGIAYIKVNYPFHYGVNLAEVLCKQAKKIGKTINKDFTPSSLMFHKVHASFIEEYDDIIEKELSAQNNVRFDYGPYFSKSQNEYLTIEELEYQIAQINKSDAPKSGLRNWLTELREKPESAEQVLERIKTVTNKKYIDRLGLKTPFTRRKIKEVTYNFTPIFDIIALSNIQKTD